VLGSRLANVHGDVISQSENMMIVVTAARTAPIGGYGIVEADMRRPGSLAFALALTLLLAPVTALACEWQCARDTAGLQDSRASAPETVDSCHRAEEASDASVSLRGALRDCDTHQIDAAARARPGVTRAGHDGAPAAMASQPRANDNIRPAAGGPLESRALAPPGPPAGSVTPLRI